MLQPQVSTKQNYKNFHATIKRAFTIIQMGNLNVINHLPLFLVIRDF
jgi:hypothetical protein